MDLFGNDPTLNLLPCDGVVNYHGPILSPADSRRYYETLLQQIPWKHDEAVIFGKHIVTARMVAWYGDSNFSYTCSGTTKQALAWTAELAALKATVATVRLGAEREFRFAAGRSLLRPARLVEAG